MNDKKHDVEEKVEREAEPIEVSEVGGDVELIEKLLKSEPRTDKLDAQLISLTIMSGIVALIGLFLNNAAIVIGAMVISPLLAPVYALSIYAVMGRYREALENLRVLIILIILIMVFSAIMTFVFSFFWSLQITPEILSRTKGHEILIMMAVILGMAVVIAHTRGFPDTIIGIGIAIALIPPAVVTGLSFVIYREGFLPALILTINNILGLIIGSFLALISLGVGPKWYFKKEESKKILIRILVLLVVILVILTILMNLL
ncbi:TIGR00341 family protein [Methanooceanicella nereidis]|nr:TIGR00341 family protein [Methanocella sp. CWC-04]